MSINRFRKGITALAAAALCLTLSTATAQQRRTLTVDESVRLGLENSKQISSSKAAVQAADARVSEIGTSRLPSLKFTGAYTRLSDVPATAFTVPGFNQSIELSPSILNNYVLRLTLQQPVFTGFQLENSQKSAEYSVQAAEREVDANEVNQAYSVKAAYWSLYRAIEVKKLNDENVQQVQAHLQYVKTLAEHGMAQNNDVLRVQVQLSDAQFRRLDAENNVRLAMVNLNNLLGLPLSTELDLASQIGSPVDDIPALDESINRALATRPDASAMQYRIQAGKAGVDAARGGWYPQVFLSANYNYNRPNSRIFPTVDEFRDTWDVGVSVSFDVWNWQATTYKTTQAEAQLAQAEYSLGLIRDGISVEITQSWISLRQARERIAVAKTGVEQAEESMRTVNESYKNGAALNTDVLDAQVALLQAKTNYTSSLVDYELARVRLRKALGEE